jgi:hypothetical protein
VVAWLLGKGWIDPWLYRRSVHLALPDVAAKRSRGIIYRDWLRPTIRVTPTGRILCYVDRPKPQHVCDDDCRSYGCSARREVQHG